ncbi:MAG TPA: hypothetical protein PLU56_05120, partial [Sphingorhabdus lacus]|nr:hypothetical protein [Sphingorhabdus lacus]
MAGQNSVMTLNLRRIVTVSALAFIAAAVPASAATPEETAREVLSKTPVIDGHNDTPHQIAELFDRDFSKFDLKGLSPDILAKTHTDIPTLRAGYLGDDARASASPNQ